jgi:hypothetical protein
LNMNLFNPSESVQVGINISLKLTTNEYGCFSVVQ